MNLLMVPIDFSPCAYNALRYAIRFARQIDAGILLLHVYHIPVYPGDMPLPDGAVTALEEDAKTRLKECREMMKKEYGTDAMIKAVPGYADTPLDIEEEASKEKVSMIIIGTEGAKGLKRLIFGSNAAHIIKHSNIPVLAVPEDSVFSGIAKIVVATTYDDYELISLKRFFNLLLSSQPLIEILHVKNDRDNDDDKMVSYRRKLESMMPSSRMIFKETAGDTAAAIEMETDFHQTDLLVMMNHQHSLFEKLFNKSITREIVFHAGVPLLVIPSRNNAVE